MDGRKRLESRAPGRQDRANSRRAKLCSLKRARERERERDRTAGPSSVSAFLFSSACAPTGLITLAHVPIGVDRHACVMRADY